MIRKKLLKLYFRLKSKQIEFKHTKLNYIFEQNKKSSTLIVIFSAFPRTGYEATYNYLRTLKDIKANKLYILDNFGYQKRGCYYLGENGERNVQESVLHLISKITSNKKFEKVICVGSSKGGYAALMFGSLIDADYIIAGAPQYYLGDYLTDNPIKNPILLSIMGDDSTESIKKLNYILPNLVKNKMNNQKVYLNYSKNEHTYEDHIKYLLNDLTDNNISMTTDVQGYTHHQDVKFWFPKFLVNSLEEIIYSDEEG
ncbi:hypothetical protein RD055328_12780 [Companilactobacillus sp. RD055328]|uniref:accessory Sec system protein Asp2 n=1 Tax=Companilactobacillus sp. RD055328 TaxID=2916634 RepID=UPI001FC7E046|nr:accessory Sec system protein Asp2 [Companilactobacillus sp. RD055328]GKQ43355.1 hypothetical protein RD055328_12780 [Companilactobacillus sp. RD055328]